MTQDANTYEMRIDDLAAAVGESPATIKRAKRSPKFPRATKQGYNVGKVREYLTAVKDRAASDLEASGGKLDLLKAERLRIEIDIAREKLSQIRQETMPLSEHLDELRGHCAVVRNVFEFVRQRIMGKGDADLLGYWDDEARRALGKLREDIAAQEDK